MTEIVHIATAIGAFLAVLMTIVFVHELGHFLAARWCGIKVRTFSIGFGRELWGFTDRYGTRWKLAPIPLGGFVSFADDASAASLEAAASAARPLGGFHTAPLAHRALVIVAGPLANFLFAIAIYAGLQMAVGVRELEPRIGSIAPGSAAETAGLRVGDVVLTVDGSAVTGFREVERLLTLGAGRPNAIRVTRGAETLDLAITPRVSERTGELGATVNAVETGMKPHVAPVVGSLTAGQPAELAGLVRGDRIRAVDGRAIENYDELVAAIVASPGRALRLDVERGATRLDIAVTPLVWQQKTADGATKTIGRLGVGMKTPEPRPLALLPALAAGTQETGRNVVDTLAGLKALFSSRNAAAQVGGPLMMAEATAEIVQFGIEPMLLWTALLSANLGLFNLLPIPVLDGGHLLFQALEAVRRRPLSARMQTLTLKLGAAVIIGMMVLVNLSDLLRLGRRLLS